MEYLGQDCLRHAPSGIFHSSEKNYMGNIFVFRKKFSAKCRVANLSIMQDLLEHFRSRLYHDVAELYKTIKEHKIEQTAQPLT